MTAPQLSVDTVRKPASDTNVAQNATDVNTQSMPEGAGISAQGALLSEESVAAVDNGTWRDIRAKRMAEGVQSESPLSPDGDIPPLGKGGMDAAGAATPADVEIDEDAVLREALGEPAVEQTAEQTQPKRIYRKKGSVPTNIRVRVAGDVSRTAEGVMPSADGYTSSVTADAATPSPQGEGLGGVRSQVQSRKQVDVSDLFVAKTFDAHSEPHKIKSHRIFLLFVKRRSGKGKHKKPTPQRCRLFIWRARRDSNP